MAVLTMAARKKIPSSKFALPGKGKGPSGKGAGSYPIQDKAHARNALSRVAQHGTPSEKATVRAKVKRRYPEIGKKQLGGIAPAAPRAPRAPRAPALGGIAPTRAFRPPPLTPRIPGRLSSSAGMKKGGMVHGAAEHRPHTYGAHKGGGRSGDPSPASCGKMSGHGNWASLGIRRHH
jgi:hypothetical protein